MKAKPTIFHHLCVLALFAFAFPAAQASVFESNVYDFAIRFPTDWTIKDSGVTGTIIKSVYRNGDDIVQMSIAAYPLPFEGVEKGQEELLVKEAWAALKALYSRSEIRQEDSGWGKVGLNRSCWIYTSMPAETGFFAKHYCFIKNDHIYRVSLQTDSGEEILQKLLPVMEQSVESMRFRGE